MTTRMMRIADVLKLPSVDSHAATYGGDDFDQWSLSGSLDAQDVTGEIYDTIRAEIIADGYNRVPIHIDLGEHMKTRYSVLDMPEWMLSSEMMGNGHHRLKIMIEEDFEWILVTDDATESTDDPAETGSGQYADVTECECLTGCNCWNYS